MAKDYFIEHKVARRVETPIRQGVLAFLLDAQTSVSFALLERAIANQAPGQVVGSIPWQALENDLTARMERLYLDAVQVAGKEFSARLPISRLVRKATEPQLAEIGFAFDVTNPRAVNWARFESALLIRGITENTRQAIRAIIVRMFEDGIPPRQAARLIRPLIGLTEPWALAVDNFRRQLQETGQSFENVDRLVSTYAKRLINHRAETIARTESIRASAVGQQELYQQAADAGILERDRARRRWLVTPDERLCPICAPMPSDPVNLTVTVDTPFTTGDGRQVMTPPAHPQCRCAVRLVFPDPITNEYPPAPKPVPPGRPKRRSRRPQKSVARSMQPQ